MKNQKGFSLIELLIVVVIIGIIAAIAIPNLLASRRAANEGSAVSSMRTIHGANATYHATKGRSKKFADTVADLTDQQLIDDSLAAAFSTATNPVAKSGYLFTYTPDNAASPATYLLEAAPEGTGITATGTRDFQVDQSGVIGDRDHGGTVTTYSPIS